MTDDYDTDNLVTEMTAEEAWAFLASEEVGRLAVHAGGTLDIYPITYVVDHGTLVFVTSPGTKLLELTINDQVAFEIDDYDEKVARSVVVHGFAERLETMAEIDAAAALPLKSLIPTPKTRYVRITPQLVTGRIFHRIAS
jgi:nitroimidazol reductase NimA-like FMN-containing flavoprotein (pyridoxamine 5'-phosphate oxidase superfamily)